MKYCDLPDYVLRDFAEDYLGYSLKGSGRFVELQKTDDIKVLKVKRFFMNRCDCNKFLFTLDSCIISRNYWNNKNISTEFDNFYEKYEKTF